MVGQHGERKLALTARFDELNEFSCRMRPFIAAAFRQVFPGAKVRPLGAPRPAMCPTCRQELDYRLLIDKYFGIDGLVELPDGSPIYYQSKIRRYQWLRRGIKTGYPDFTQEVRNGQGTLWDAPGEWFKLHAQVYFYGWANEAEDGLAQWIILDVLEYKRIVLAAGGLPMIGQQLRNRRHGAAEFYAISVRDLEAAIIGRSMTDELHR